MVRTKDSFSGVREDEEGIDFIESSSLASVEGELRYHNTGRFSFYDSTGEFDPRSGGGGLSESQHEGLDRLTHNINESSYDEYITSGNKITDVITWTDSGKTLKIREINLTYTGSKVTQAVTIQYNGSGTEVERLTEVPAYSGNTITSITRTYA
jgi:hypothetical protein